MNRSPTAMQTAFQIHAILRADLRKIAMATASRIRVIFLREMAAHIPALCNGLLPAVVMGIGTKGLIPRCCGLKPAISALGWAGTWPQFLRLLRIHLWRHLTQVIIVGSVDFKHQIPAKTIASGSGFQVKRGAIRIGGRANQTMPAARTVSIIGTGVDTGTIITLL